MGKRAHRKSINRVPSDWKILTFTKANVTLLSFDRALSTVHLPIGLSISFLLIFLSSSSSSFFTLLKYSFFEFLYIILVFIKYFSFFEWIRFQPFLFVFDFQISLINLETVHFEIIDMCLQKIGSF